MKRIILTTFLIFAVFQIFSQRVFENKYIVVHRTWGDYVVNARGAKVSITDTINGVAVPMTDGDTIVYVNSVTGLTPITTFTREPGTEPIFALNRNTTFTGTINISDDSLKFCSYGHSGTKPVISGFTEVTDWTQINDTIWESTNAVSTLDYLNIVLINGRNIPMGRIPNDGEVYAVDAVVNDSYIVASELTGTPDYTGAQIVIRKNAYAWQTANITSQSTDTLYYTDVYSSDYVVDVNDGFFIQSDSSTLDVQNEWYYNTSTKKLQIYSTIEPTDVKVPTVANLVSSDTKNYITFKNIAFEGANEFAIIIDESDYVTIDNCNINNIGWNGFYSLLSDYPTVKNSSFSNCNFSAIFDYQADGSEGTGSLITNNTIDSTFLNIGIGNKYYMPGAIQTNSESSLVRYNRITNSGKEAIKVQSNVAQVKNNFINNSLLKVTDGGGIYTAGNKTNLVIDGNIVLNSLGSNLGIASTTFRGAVGIYLDEGTSNVRVSNNTVANSDRGIYIHSSSSVYAENDTVENNTVFNNTHSALYFQNDDASGQILNNIVNNNQFVATKVNQGYPFYDDQLAMHLNSSNTDADDFISVADSNIFARPLMSDTTLIRVDNTSATYSSIAGWRAFSGLDANSTVLNRQYIDDTEMSLIYNSTNSVFDSTFTTAKIDMKDNPVTSISLNPYESIIVGNDVYYKHVGDTIASTAFAPAASQIRSYAVTFASADTVYAIEVAYSTTAAGNFVAGIYSDSGSNAPVNLLSSTAVHNRGTGGVSKSRLRLTTPVYIAAGQKVWIAIINDATGINMYYATGTANNRNSVTYTWDGTLPASFPGGAAASSGTFNLSAVVKN